MTYLELDHKRLLRRLDEVERKIEERLAMGDDTYAVGTVLLIRKKYANRPGHLYSYAVIKISESQWYLTGRITVPYSWDHLVDYMFDQGVVVEMIKMKKGKQII